MLVKLYFICFMFCFKEIVNYCVFYQNITSCTQPISLHIEGLIA